MAGEFIHFLLDEQKEVDMVIHTLGRTGPKSIPGKQHSSMNALKHGAFAQTKVLPFEDALEYERLLRDFKKSLKPKTAAELHLVTQIVDCLWRIARMELRMTHRREEVLKELTPQMLANMLGVPTEYEPHAPDYLLNTNHKIAKKELKGLDLILRQYRHLLANVKGVQNFNMVWRQYPDLFQGMGAWVGDRAGAHLFNSSGSDLSLGWQQKPDVVLKYLEQYAAHVYYTWNFEDLKPSLRVWMSSWLFLQKRYLHDCDFQDERIAKESRRFQSLLDSYWKLHKSMEEQALSTLRLNQASAKLPESSKFENEMPHSQEKSTS